MDMARTNQKPLFTYVDQSQVVLDIATKLYTLDVILECVCVCFLPIHSGHQVRWTYQPG